MFHGRRHPDELGELEITGFLSALVTDLIAYLSDVPTRAKESPGAVLLPADFSAQLAAA